MSKVKFEIEIKEEDIKGRCLFHKYSTKHKDKKKYSRSKKHKKGGDNECQKI